MEKRRGGVILRETQGLKNKLKTGFETDSNLSLGTRLTRVKRLSRKRCCDTTPDRCQEGTVVCRIDLFFDSKFWFFLNIF